LKSLHYIAFNLKQLFRFIDMKIAKISKVRHEMQM